MHPSYGPLRLVAALADGCAEVGIVALTSAWERWISPTRFHRKLAQFTRAGAIEIRGSNLERVVRLTQQGRLAALGGRDPEASWNRPWDGRWRLALFDVPEVRNTDRVILRRTLRSAGCGCLQNSVWITPDTADTLRRLAGESDIDAGTLSFFEGRPCAGETDVDIVTAAWDFARINRHYEQYCALLSSRPSRAHTPAARRSWFDAEWRAWQVAISADPLLPEPLLPAGYRGRMAWNRRRDALHQFLQQ